MDFELQRLKGQVPESVKFLEDLSFVWDGSAAHSSHLRYSIRRRPQQNRYVRIALHPMSSHRKKLEA